MPQYVAIEIDRTGFSASVVEEHSSGPEVTQVVRVNQDSLGNAAALAEVVRQNLPGVRWSRARLIGVLGGDQVRCRLLKLPPAPHAELPDLVKLQAAREFATAEGDGIVDFVPLSGDEASPHTVLAATAEPESLQRVRTLAAELDAPLDQVVARGGAAASLALRLFPELSSGSHLLVAAAEQAADLIAIDSGATSLLRSTRVAADADPATLASEARRTSAMAAQQLGRRMNATSYIGFTAPPSRSESSSLDVPLRLTQQFGLPVEQAETAGRMTGVIGAALLRASDYRPSIDFLNPRKPVRDTSQRKRKVLLAAAAAACVLLGVVWAYSQIWSLDAQIESAKKLLTTEQKQVDDFQPMREQAATVEAWLATDVNWLDELERLGRKLRPVELDAKDFPEEQDVYLKLFTASGVTQRGVTGGRIDLRALSRNPYSYDEIEQALRDADHEVETTTGNALPGEGKYGWETQTVLRVAPDIQEVQK